MSSNYQASVTLRVEASQFMSTLDQANQKMQQTGQSGEQMAQKAQSAGQRMDGFTSSLKNMVSPMMAISGGVIGLAQNYIGLERAGVMAERMQTRMVQAHMATQKAQEAYDAAVQKGLGNTAEGIKLLDKLNLAKAKESTATDAATIAQERLNVMWANFVDNIMPQALSILGGVTGVLQVYEGRSKGAESATGKLKNAFSDLGNSISNLSTVQLVGLGAGIAAVAIVLTAIATNAWGFRDALNGIGKAIGDAVPALKPLLLGIKTLGEALGLTGTDAKTTQKDWDTSWKGMNDSTNRIVPNITDHMHTLAQSTDLPTRALGELQIAAERNLSAVESQAKAAANQVVLEFKNIYDNIVKMDWIGVGRSIIAAFVQVPGAIQAQFNVLGAMIVSAISKALEQLPGVLAGIGTAVGTAFNNAAAAIRVSIGMWPGIIKDAFTNAAWALTQLGGIIWDNLSKAFAPIPGQIAAEVTKWPGEITKGLNAMANAVIGFGAQLWGVIATELSSIPGKIIAFFSGLAETARKEAAKIPLIGGAFASKTPELTSRYPQGTGGYFTPTPPPRPPEKPGLIPGLPTLANYEVTPGTYGRGFQQVAYQPVAAPTAPTQPTAGAGASIAASELPISSGKTAMDKAYESARQYAVAHKIMIPEALGRTNDAVTKYIQSMQRQDSSQATAYANAIKYLDAQGRSSEANGKSVEQVINMVKSEEEYSKELNKVSESNRQLQTQYDATRDRLVSGRAAAEDYTQGVLQQRIEMQKLQEQHLTNAGALQTYYGQVTSGVMQEAAYALAVDDTKKALLDSIVALSTTQGKIDELNRELATGAPQQVAYSKGWQSVEENLQKGRLEIAQTQGSLDAMDTALRTGIPTTEAYFKGWQDARGEFQKMATDTAELAGRLQYLNAVIMNGTGRLAEYLKGMAAGRVAADEWFLSVSENVGKQQAFHDQLLALAKRFGIDVPDGIKNSVDAIQRFIGVTQGVPEVLQKVYDEISKAGDALRKGFGDVTKNWKDAFKDMPNYLRNLLPKDIWKDIIQTGQMQTTAEKGVETVNGILGMGFTNAARTASQNLASELQSGIGRVDASVRPKWNTLINLLANPPGLGASAETWAKWHEQVNAAIANLSNPMNAYNNGVGNMADVTTKNVNAMISTWSKLQAEMASLTAAPKIPGAADISSRFKNLPPGGQAGPTTQQPAAGGQSADMFNQLSTAASAAQAVLQRVATTIQQVGTAISTLARAIVTTATDFTNLQTAISAVQQSTQGFAQTVQQSATGISTLARAIVQTTSDLSSLARAAMTTGTDFTTMGSKAASAAGGGISSLARAMTQLTSNVNVAARAVVTLQGDINRLPASKTITILVNNSQALSAIRATQSAINSLHGVNVTNTVTTVYRSVYQSTYIGIPAATQAISLGAMAAPGVKGGGTNTTIAAPAPAGASGPVTIVVNIGGREVWREVRKSLFENISQY